MDNTSKLYSQAFKDWKTSFDQVQHALKSFLEECTRLDLVFQQPVGHGQCEREKALAGLHAALTHSETWLSDLRSAHTSLDTLRSRCNALAPINKLPAETLTHILSLVETGCVIDAPQKPSVGPCSEKRLSSVLSASKRLHEAATSAHELWTHVDLVIGGAYQKEFMDHARACLKYSGQRDLHVHIAEVKDDPDRCSTDIVELLELHRSRIGTLNIQAVNPHTSDIVLGLCSDISTCRTTKLYLNGHTSNWRVPGDYDIFFDGRLDSLLSSLEVFSIAGPAPPLNHPNHSVFRGLTVLSVVDPMDPRITTTQLRDVLVCCPELRALSLIYFYLEPSAGTQLERVVLPNLEILDLRRSAPDNVSDILSFIHTGSHRLALSLDLEETGDITAVKEARDFIEQLKVTRLLLETDEFYRTDSLPVVLEYGFPALRELAFSNFTTRELIDSDAMDRAWFPSLHTVHMLNCPTVTEEVEQLFESSAARVVYSTVLGDHGAGFDKFPWFQYRSYPYICRGNDELEWPVRIPN